MDKEKLLTPTKTFEKFSEITPEFLLSEGVFGLMCDIDDCLVVHNFPLPTDEVKKWAKSLYENGIQLILISNNTYKRAAPFAKALCCPFLTMAQKPSEKFLIKALAVMNIKKENAAFLGDQLYTDIKGGNLFGIKTYKVIPVGNKAPVWVKIKRKMERKYEK